jgi:hypothetical protein
VKGWDVWSPHFEPEEILSPELLGVLKTKNVLPYSLAAIVRLNNLRMHVGPILVNGGSLRLRGGRSPSELLTIHPGYSYHLWCAFDCTPQDIGLDEFYGKILEAGCWRGIGRYDTFIHIDCRDAMSGGIAEWDLRTRKE